MKNQHRLLGMLALCGALTASIIAEAPAKAKPAKKATPKVRFLTSHKDALVQARKTGKPILMDFNATWCGPCHMLNDEVFQSSSFAKEAPKWVLLSVDIDKHPDLAKHYSIGPIPTLIVLNSKGRSISKQEGYNRIMTWNWIKSSYNKAKAKKN